MEVTIKLEIDQTVITHLYGYLGISDPKELEEVISKHAQAATAEYHDMFLGRKVFRRGSDILEYRLVLLIEHLFGGIIPEERQVSALFQLTSTESRSLLRSVMSKYQHHLSDSLTNTLRSTIDRASFDQRNYEYTVSVNNRSIIDSLNLLLAFLGPTLVPIVKKRNTTTTYAIANSSHQALKDHFGL